MPLASSPVPPLPPHQLLIFLLQVFALLGLAILMGRAAARIGMPALVGELLVGLLLGPSLLGHIAPDLSGWLLPREAGQMHLLDAFGQIGVLLLVGITGSHLDFAMVRRRGRTAAQVSLSGLLIPLALGVGVGYLVPGSLVPDSVDRPVFALFLGVAMCVSAIPVIAKTLTDMNLLHRNIGQLTLAAGIVDDIIGWLLLSVVSALAVSHLDGGRLGLSLLYLALVVAFAALPGRPLARWILQRAGASAGPGGTVAAATALMLGGAAATQAMGLEAVFGAFVAGIVIGTCGAIEPHALAPLRTVVLGVLAPVFFATVGLRVDLSALARPEVLGTGLAVLAVAILGKFGGAYLGARLGRLGRWEALALGAGMNARGVIEVVVAMAGLNLGVLSGETFTIVILVAVVTSLMAPPILRVAMARVEHTAEERLRGAALLGPEAGERIG
ncbi:cation:proton antiporter [Actinomadura oligospora]|uniref:cation:proton antiporter n=1 Tax=Actinomadura oligospora TaxID=111804 RepID=UPI000557E99D|nr:cation:proton antiporter [Actinomadura oligospora]